MIKKALSSIPSVSALSSSTNLNAKASVLLQSSAGQQQSLNVLNLSDLSFDVKMKRQLELRGAKKLKMPLKNIELIWKLFYSNFFSDESNQSLNNDNSALINA